MKSPLKREWGRYGWIWDPETDRPALLVYAVLLLLLGGFLLAVALGLLG